MRHFTLSRPCQPNDHDERESSEKIVQGSDISKKNRSIDEGIKEGVSQRKLLNNELLKIERIPMVMNEVHKSNNFQKESIKNKELLKQYGSMLLHKSHKLNLKGDAL